MLLPAVVRAFVWNQNLQEQIHVLSPGRGVAALGVACAGSSLLVSSLTYRLSRAALQKHLNLRWHKCVQLISSTVAPSSGSFFLSVCLFLFCCCTTRRTTGREPGRAHAVCAQAERGPALSCSPSLYTALFYMITHSQERHVLRPLSHTHTHTQVYSKHSM